MRTVVSDVFRHDEQPVRDTLDNFLRFASQGTAEILERTALNPVCLRIMRLQVRVLPGAQLGPDLLVQPTHGSLIAPTWLKIAAKSSNAHCSLIFPSPVTR